MRSALDHARLQLGSRSESQHDECKVFSSTNYRTHRKGHGEVDTTRVLSRSQSIAMGDMQSGRRNRTVMEMTLEHDVAEDPIVQKTVVHISEIVSYPCAPCERAAFRPIRAAVKFDDDASCGEPPAVVGRKTRIPTSVTARTTTHEGMPSPLCGPSQFNRSCSLATS